MFALNAFSVPRFFFFFLVSLFSFGLEVRKLFPWKPVYTLAAQWVSEDSTLEDLL